MGRWLLQASQARNKVGSPHWIEWWGHGSCVGTLSLWLQELHDNWYPKAPCNVNMAISLLAGKNIAHSQVPVMPHEWFLILAVKSGLL